MTRYEIVHHYDNDKVVATVWWDGRAIKADDDSFLPKIKNLNIQGTTFSDGPRFLAALPGHFKSGYIGVRKKHG